MTGNPNYTPQQTCEDNAAARFKSDNVGRDSEIRRWRDAGVDPELTKPPLKHIPVEEVIVTADAAVRVSELRRGHSIMLGGIQK